MLLGFNKKKYRALRVLPFPFPSVFESKLSTLLEMQKASQILTGFSL
jgi:hypothetical protein